MGGITGQLTVVEQSAYLKPEAAERVLASMPSWLELVPVPVGQQSIQLVSLAGVREQQLAPGPIPAPFSSPGSPQQAVWRPRGENLSQTISVAHCQLQNGRGADGEHLVSARAPDHSSPGPLSSSSF